MASQQQSPELSVDVVASQGLRSIRQLRQQTHETLQFLRDGIQAHNDDVLSDEHIFVKEAKMRLAGIMESFEQLDKLTTMLPKPPPNFGGNLTYLLQKAISEGPFGNADSSASSTASYDDVFGTYTWLQRANEYSHLTVMFVGQYMRRGQSKLLRRQPAIVGITAQQLGQLLAQFQKLPGLHISTIPRGRNTVLIFVTVGAMPQQIVGSSSSSAVFKTVILARLQPFSLEWANVKGADEEFYDDDGKLDVHSQSRYRVFQKLSSQVKGAILHQTSLMSSPGQPLQTLLKTFFMWLSMHKNVFTDPCTNCKRILRDYLPPYCRDYRKIDQTFHESCK